nr:PEPxxWA-CTERM sorting domain-containing protein [Polymorphobacter sp.]
MTIKFALAAAAVLCAATPAAANLLSNGGFEATPTTGYQYDATAPGGHVQSFSGGPLITTQYLPGWTIAKPFESDMHRAPSGYGGYPAAAAEGQQYLALNWSPAVYTLTNSIRQTFTLGAGATGITMSLFMASEVGYNLSPLTASIYTLGGTSLASSGAFYNTAGNRNWDAKTWSTALGAGTYTFELYGVGTGNAWDVLVDDVVLNQVGGGTGGVPEPASWAMLIAGFGLTGAAMRRRSMAVVAA